MSKSTKTHFLSSECRTAYQIATTLGVSPYDAQALIDQAGLKPIGTTDGYFSTVAAYSIKDADQLIALVRNRRENRGSE